MARQELLAIGEAETGIGKFDDGAGAILHEFRSSVSEAGCGNGKLRAKKKAGAACTALRPYRV